MEEKRGDGRRARKKEMKEDENGGRRRTGQKRGMGKKREGLRKGREESQKKQWEEGYVEEGQA